LACLESHGQYARLLRRILTGSVVDVDVIVDRSRDQESRGGSVQHLSLEPCEVSSDLPSVRYLSSSAIPAAREPADPRARPTRLGASYVGNSQWPRQRTEASRIRCSGRLRREDTGLPLLVTASPPGAGWHCWQGTRGPMARCHLPVPCRIARQSTLVGRSWLSVQDLSVRVFRNARTPSDSSPKLNSRQDQCGRDGIERVVVCCVETGECYHFEYFVRITEMSKSSNFLLDSREMSTMQTARSAGGYIIAR